MAANEQRMTPLEIEDTSCKQRQEEIVDEQDPSIGPVQVKSASRTRRKVIVICACIIVVVIVIVTAVLIGVHFTRKDGHSGDGKNKSTYLLYLFHDKFNSGCSEFLLYSSEQHFENCCD